MEHKHQTGELQRTLKNRHIQLITLGGAIGTGLFLGSAATIGMAGPSIILGYAIGGFIAFLIMRQLGDMVAEEPVAGSFSHFAYKYWGEFAGFMSGWNYWILYILVGIAELTASAAYMTYWYPSVPTWIWALVFFAAINAINMLTVKAYGEMEFWFALIKIVAILLMICLGAYLLLAGTVEGATVANLWKAPSTGASAGNAAQSGFFPFGIGGLIMALPIIMFSFGGLELVGITAAEADNPRTVIPKAINQVIYRILIFYIGTFFVLLSLYHWSYLSQDMSPFILIFEKIGFTNVAGLLNFIVLTAALSVYNSCVYCDSRMLYGLSLQGNAPRVFSTVDKRGVPMPALLLAGLLTFMAIPLNALLPAWQDAFGMAMSVVVGAAIINWAMIIMAHLKFRQQMKRENRITVFPALWFPVGNYIALAFNAFILYVMYAELGMKKVVIAVPIWVCATYIGYLLLKRKNARTAQAETQTAQQAASGEE